MVLGYLQKAKTAIRRATMIIGLAAIVGASGLSADNANKNSWQNSQQTNLRVAVSNEYETTERLNRVYEDCRKAGRNFNFYMGNETSHYPGAYDFIVNLSNHPKIMAQIEVAEFNFPSNHYIKLNFALNERTKISLYPKHLTQKTTFFLTPYQMITVDDKIIPYDQELDESAKKITEEVLQDICAQPITKTNAKIDWILFQNGFYKEKNKEKEKEALEKARKDLIHPAE
jgi:hypothetical protein